MTLLIACVLFFGVGFMVGYVVKEATVEEDRRDEAMIVDINRYREEMR